MEGNLLVLVVVVVLWLQTCLRYEGNLIQQGARGDILARLVDSLSKAKQRPEIAQVCCCVGACMFHCVCDHT